MSFKIYSNVLVRDNVNKKLLLGLKKRGFGKDKWSFFGLNPTNENETLIESAIRQTKEETGLEISDLKHIGYIETQVGNNIMAGNLYVTSSFKGQVRETDDLRPEWFDENDLPTTHRWLDDKYWFDKVLANQFIKARFVYTENLETLITHKVEVFDTSKKLEESLKDIKHIQELITKCPAKSHGI